MSVVEIEIGQKFSQIDLLNLNYFELLSAVKISNYSFIGFECLLKSTISIKLKNINPQCLSKMFSVKKLMANIIQKDTLRMLNGLSEVLNKKIMNIKKEIKPSSPVVIKKYK
ncbi:hypothetical protein N9Q68_01630 [Polaribacter sp.]|nr:hypothetical protein [Polaribacter sp.]